MSYFHESQSDVYDAWEALTEHLTAVAIGMAVKDLRGLDLCCWCCLCERHADGKPLSEQCPDCAPCHVDPLGEIANRSTDHD